MFEKDYFEAEEITGPGRIGVVVGGVGGWGLHLAKIAFLIYSGYHGISATAGYRGDSEFALIAGIVGIVVTEVVLLSIYLAWHNQRITGAAQSIAAGLTYSIGFVIACLAIVADSQLHAGLAMSPWLAAYTSWGLPVAPAVMALGAILIHELEPHQLRGRKEATAQSAFNDQLFQAAMAGKRAELTASKMIKNMQLNARQSAAKQIAAWYASDDAQAAIAATAMQNAPALLRAAGVNVADHNPGSTPARNLFNAKDGSEEEVTRRPFPNANGR